MSDRSDRREPWTDSLSQEAPPPWGDADPLDPLATAATEVAPSRGPGADLEDGTAPPEATPDIGPGKAETLDAVTDGAIPETPVAETLENSVEIQDATVAPKDETPSNPDGPSGVAVTDPQTTFAVATSIVVPANWPDFPARVSSTTLQRLSSMRSALVRREFAKSQAQLNRPETTTKSTVDSESMARMARIVYEAEIFWKAVDDALSRVAPGDTLTIPAIQWQAKVISKSTASLVLEREDGKQGAVSTIRSEMRSPLAGALAEWELKERGPARYLPLAVFWSLEQNKHPEIAAAYWQLAMNAGLAVDAVDPNIAQQTR